MGDRLVQKRPHWGHAMRVAFRTCPTLEYLAKSPSGKRDLAWLAGSMEQRLTFFVSHAEGWGVWTHLKAQGILALCQVAEVCFLWCVRKENFRGELKGINWMGQTEPNSQFCANFRWFLLIFLAFPGNYSISEKQIFAENRRKPQIFTENRRKPQIFMACFHPFLPLSLSLTEGEVACASSTKEAPE